MNAIEALGDPTRRKLFERLQSGPCSVGELSTVVPVSQPAVSQHLQVLKDARLVRVHRHGRRRIYSVDPEGLAELRAYVEGLWDNVLAAYGKAATQSEREESSDV